VSFSFGESVTSRYIEIELSDSQFVSEVSKTLNSMNDDVLIHARNSRILITYPSRSDASDASRLLKTTFANHRAVKAIRLLVVSDFCLLEVQWRSSTSLNTALARQTLLGK
jgi:deoxyhypusine synthase